MPETLEKFAPSPGVSKVTNGGTQLKNVGVSLIFWGKAWGANRQPTPSVAQLTSAARSLLNGNYLSSLSQYGYAGNSTLIAVDIVADSDPPTSHPDPKTGASVPGFSDEQLQAMVTSRIQGGTVPAPVVNNTRLYAVICTQGASGPGGGTGEHQPFSYAGVTAATAWCLSDGTLTSNFSALQCLSHELAEACSDPSGGNGVRLITTDNRNFEIGDICRWSIDTSNGYAIQAYYSDADKACVIPLTRVVLATQAQFSAVSRGPDSLSVAVVGSDGITYQAAWDQTVRQGRWRGWWSINGGQTIPSGPICLVARSAHQLDAFVTGSDGKIYTAAWDSSNDVFDGAWRGWWPIVTGEAPPGAPVVGVSRDPNKLDVFVAAGDGSVWTSAWDQNVANAQWRGWWRIPGLLTTPGGNVTAVSRAPGKLDIFAVGSDGKIYTAAWDQLVANGAWRGWWPVAGGQAPPGARVHAVSRDPNKLDVFVIGNDGGIWTAAWDQNVANAAWRGWWRIGALNSLPGGNVTVVSRDPNKLDVFAVAMSGEIATAAWDQNVDRAVWRGWWPVAGGVSLPGSAVAVVARAPDRLDVWCVGTDGSLATAAWAQEVANGAWQGWWPIPN
jgi:hypothetical protein